MAILFLLQKGLLWKPHIKEIDLSESRCRAELEAFVLDSALNRQTPRSFLARRVGGYRKLRQREFSCACPKSSLSFE